MAKPTMHVKFDFTETPPKAWKSELRAFVVDALETWGGSRHPDDWLFNSLKNVTVTFAKGKAKP